MLVRGTPDPTRAELDRIISTRFCFVSPLPCPACPALPAIIDYFDLDSNLRRHSKSTVEIRELEDTDPSPESERSSGLQARDKEHPKKEKLKRKIAERVKEEAEAKVDDDDDGDGDGEEKVRA